MYRKPYQFKVMKILKLILLLVTSLIIIAGCDIFDNDDTTMNFSTIQSSQIESFMQGEIFEELRFELEDDSGNLQEITDSLRFTWSADSLWFNSYSNAPESLLDSLENAYVDNSLLVLSQEQTKIFYNIKVDENTLIRDSTFTFISENLEDTTKAVVSTQEMDAIYANAGFTYFENDTAVINNFDLDNDLQIDSFNRFKSGVQFTLLEWLPDSTFVPNVPFFRIEGNTVIFGAFEKSDRSKTYNMMQTAFKERYRLFIEQM